MVEAQELVREMFNDTFVDAMDVGRWAVHYFKIHGSLKLYSYYMYANLGQWRDAGLDNIPRNSHFGLGIHFAGSIQIMVGTFFTTPFECGPIFRNNNFGIVGSKGY